ncbi:hypothetical protein QLS71_006815 [Mariniflexile litorale]|uniref:O-antigen/teichoic acid export membrane protein n=1 Tax=Mariniflexile litorale TaxID=3045158 RepID=A0AAU7EJN4_9FLAO|nr:hypothetical protein [Mariniflexile sp. KMM 9835]
MQVLNLVLTFIAIKFLSLSELGRYNIAKSISGTFQFANLGFRNALDRRLPESKNEDLNLLRLSICAYINTVVSVFILAFFLIRYGLDWFYLLYAIGGVFLASFTLLRVYLRGTNQISSFISASFYGGVLPILLPIIGLYFFGLAGLGMAFFIATSIIFTYYFQKIKLRTIKETLNFKGYAFLFFKTGIIIYLTNFFEFIANNFDRFIIESYSGLETVGEYGIIILVYSLSLVIPGGILEMLFPDYIRDKKNKVQLIKHAKRHLLVNISFIGLFILISYFLLPYIIPFLFEKYTYLVFPMQIILFALIPYAIIGPIYSVLFAFDRHKQMFYANLISTVFYFAFLFLVLSNDFSILNLVYIKIGYTFLYLILMFGCLFHSIFTNKISFEFE